MLSHSTSFWMVGRKRMQDTAEKDSRPRIMIAFSRGAGAHTGGEEPHQSRREVMRDPVLQNVLDQFLQKVLKRVLRQIKA
jgi:hypothetical protein